MIEKFDFARLTPTTSITPFDCSSEDLNNFLVEDARNYDKHFLAVTYLLVNGEEIVAYFSMLNDCIRIEDAFKEDTSNTQKRKRRKEILSELPHEKRGFDFYPAVKIGRFAVNKNYSRCGVGSELMQFIKGVFLDKEQNKTGCRFITVDAIKTDTAINFYLKNGFKFLKEEEEPDDNTRLMYADLIKL